MFEKVDSVVVVALDQLVDYDSHNLVVAVAEVVVAPSNSDAVVEQVADLESVL